MNPLRFQPGRQLLTHQLPRQVFAELCSGAVTSEFVRTVLAAQYSRRKLLLRGLLDLCIEHPGTIGPLTDVETLWGILATAEERTPAVVEDILTYPMVGVWATRILRRIHGDEKDSVPVWSELGYLHSLVASAAVRTGISCEIRLPVIYGMVTLPTVGQIELPTSFPLGFVELRSSRNGISLSTSHGGNLVTITSIGHSRHVVPSQRHVSVSRGLQLDIEINDMDPYREFSAPIPPQRMDPARLTEWRKMLDEAFDILTMWHPGYARELAAGLRVVIPLTPGGTVKGASSSVAIGGVGAADKATATDLAETLVHEFQHSKLNGLLSMFDIGGQQTYMYAPWRDDPRPMTGLLHGILAFLSVAEFWRTQRHMVGKQHQKVADFTFALRRHQVVEAVVSLRDHPELTDVGRQLVDAIDARLDPLLLQPISAELAAAVATITDDHRSTWRLRHTRPDPQDIVRLTVAWLTGTPAPDVGARRVVPDPGPIPRSLRRDFLILDATRDNAVDEIKWHSTVSSADSAFLRGDYAAASAAYMTLARNAPDDVDSWVGFGLALRSDDNPAAAGILDAPEVAVALYKSVLSQTGTGPDLLRLAGWLSGRATGVQ